MPTAAQQSILVLNAGSSSVKFALYGSADAKLELAASGAVEGIGASPRFRVCVDGGDDVGEPGATLRTQEDATVRILRWVETRLGERRLAAVGNRVVHGGEVFDRPVVVDASVLAQIEALVPLAPLHQPHALAAMRAVSDAFSRLPQVACFDTAFHRTLPHLAQMFALPRNLTEQGIRRYGFHGLSYEYIASILPQAAPDLAAAARVVVAHLGSGASMCALRDGRSIATTMGFTPLDGLPMGTRCGSIDPGVLLYLIDRLRLDARRLERLLYEESGLLGVSGISADMRTLLDSDEPRAREAVDLFVYRIRCELGSLTAALGGIDALVFTGGIGEASAEIRARVCRAAAWLGLRLDEDANGAGGPRLSTAQSTVSTWVIPTDENRMVAQHTQRLTLSN
ncbi:MAG: acetate/propionate family kinase [Deltaproteobacteria bacterium]|nr:acetate/propionate family kinase [Deltaproteobacteria bacterium]